MANPYDKFKNSSIYRLNIKSLNNYIALHHNIINNYLSQVFLIPPFSTPLYSFPGALLVIKIDKLFMSYNHKHDPLIIRFLSSLLDKYPLQLNDGLTYPTDYIVSDTPLTKGSYHQKRTYTSTYDRCHLLYKPKKLKRPQPKNNPDAAPKYYYKPSKIELHDPTFSELDQIIQIIGHLIKYSRIEVSFDFYSTDILAVYKFLSEHVILPGVRTYYPFIPEPGDDPYSTYLSDTRKNTARAGIIYIKDSLFCRTELILNREYICKKGIDSSFRSFIHNLRFEDYFKVLYFDKHSLLEYLIKKLSTSDRNVINKYYDDFDFSNPQADEPLVDTVQKLKVLKIDGKKVANWSRYLKLIPFPMKKL